VECISELKKSLYVSCEPDNATDKGVSILSIGTGHKDEEFAELLDPDRMSWRYL
jgi:hypothetical protein